MPGKHETFGSPPVLTLDVPPAATRADNCWKPQVGPDGVTRLVPATLMELKGDLHRGAQVQQTVDVVKDWELWR